MSFNRIPVDLRAYQQFVVWRYVDRGGPTPTKLPFSPRNGQVASVTDATTWATFNESVAAFDNGGFDGIGFVFTNADPFAGIDLYFCHELTVMLNVVNTGALCMPKVDETPKPVRTPPRFEAPWANPNGVHRHDGGRQRGKRRAGRHDPLLQGDVMNPPALCRCRATFITFRQRLPDWHP
jgi:hypothetical protein